MTLASGQYRHTCTLPPSKLGLQQDLEYRLAAGDFVSRTFQVEVQIAPAILVETVEYEYPAYTGMPKRTFQRQGDLRALEGTRVRILAEANRPIGKAEIDLDCDSLRGVRMSTQQRKASGQFDCGGMHSCSPR